MNKNLFLSIFFFLDRWLAARYSCNIWGWLAPVTTQLSLGRAKARRKNSSTGKFRKIWIRLEKLIFSCASIHAFCQFKNIYILLFRLNMVTKKAAKGGSSSRSVKTLNLRENNHSVVFKIKFTKTSSRNFDFHLKL